MNYDEPEVWKPIVGYEGKYEVSSYGNVKSLKKDVIMSPKIVDNTQQINLWIDGSIKCHSIHKLVAIAFIPNPEGYPVAYHKDGNTRNNYYKNIAWGNITDVIRPPFKLRSIAKLSMSGELLGTYRSAEEAAKDAGVCSESIRRALHGYRNSAVGFQWAFVDTLEDACDIEHIDVRVHKCRQCGRVLPTKHFDIKRMKDGRMIKAICFECTEDAHRFKYLFRIISSPLSFKMDSIKFAKAKLDLQALVDKFNANGFKDYKYWNIGGCTYASYIKM
jgi:hypothetical protein